MPEQELVPAVSRDPYADLTALLKADEAAARASIAQTVELAFKMGIDLGTDGPPKRPKSYVSGSKGKSKPQLDQWLLRALDDGLLPRPTENLIISDRMVRQALAEGLIEGTRHPYRITDAGRRFAGLTG